MLKAKKYILFTVLLVLIVYFGYTFIIAVKFKHHTEFFTYKKYLWIINDTVQSKIDTLSCVGDTRESDSYYTYRYRNIYIGIWEFKELGKIELNKISILKNVNLNNLKFNSGEILNKNMENLPLISVKFKLNFINDIFCVNLNEYSIIHKTYNTNKFIGFFGDIHKMSLSNIKGDHSVIFDYGKKLQPTLFLLYKRRQSFFIIMINSDEPIDESVINILNLS